MFSTHIARRSPRSQRGAALVYGMVAILVLMISAIALVRSTDTSTSIAGSLGFRRDLTNQTDRGVVAARDLFVNGALATLTNRNSNQPAANYSSVALANDSNGIPIALLSDTAFGNVGTPNCTSAGGNDICDGTTTIRYVIDRMCISSAAGLAPTTTTCQPYVAVKSQSGSSRIQQAIVSNTWVYRISVRVTGPKNTMTFIQTTLGA